MKWKGEKGEMFPHRQTRRLRRPKGCTKWVEKLGVPLSLEIKTPHSYYYIGTGETK